MKGTVLVPGTIQRFESAKKVSLVGELSTEDLDKLKADCKEGGFSIEVGGHIGYFRNPTRQDINIASSQLDPDLPIDFFEIIMKEIFVGGSKDIIEKEDLYLGAIQQVRKKIDGPKAKLVNW